MKRLEFMGEKNQISTTIKMENLTGILSMLERFALDQDWNDLRETYFKKIAIPAIKSFDPKSNPKTLNEALLILKKHLKKEKLSTPKF